MSSERCSKKIVGFGLRIAARSSPTASSIWPGLVAPTIGAVIRNELAGYGPVVKSAGIKAE